MRKNSCWVVLLVGLLVGSCGKKTVIEGVVTDAVNSKLVLENFNAGKPIGLDTVTLDEKGAFKFQTPALDTTEIYNLYLNGNKVIHLVAKPEDKITVTANKQNFGANYNVQGSEESALLQKAEQKLWETRRQLEELKEQYKKTTDKEKKQQLSKEYDAIFAKHYDYLRHFVFDNSHSLVAYLGLYQKTDNDNLVLGGFNDDKYVRAVAQKMSGKNPNSPYLSLLLYELEMRKKQKRSIQIAEMMQQVKNSYPNLNLTDEKGINVELRKLKAKYALLYFGILNERSKATLLPIYQKYHKRGLEIYFVDENPNKNVWKEAVKDLKTPWVNVHDTSKIAANTYNIQQIPANYIIDIDGTIEGKDLFGRYLTEKLNKLF